MRYAVFMRPNSCTEGAEPPGPRNLLDHSRTSVVFLQGASERRSMGGQGASVLPREADRAEQRRRGHEHAKRVTSVKSTPRHADLEPVQRLQRLSDARRSQFVNEFPEEFEDSEL